MHLFVTYGKKGIRGIQVRGLRVASCFNKDEVVFVNDGESDFLRNEGYRVVDMNFNQIMPTQKLQNDIFKKLKPEMIIFCDLPTNRLTQPSFLLLANKNKIPVIVFENNYRKSQFNERVYQNTLEFVDFMFVNSLSAIKAFEHKKILPIPPFVNKPNRTLVDYWKKKLGLTKKQFTILIFAYNEKVVDIVKKIIRETQNEENVKLIITGQTEKDILKEDHSVKIPFVNYKDVSALISLSDVVIGKMGYMQFLETLSLGKVFISVGKEKGFRKYWLDNKLKEVCFHFDDFDHTFMNFFRSILNGNNKKIVLEEKIALLHDASFFDPVKLRAQIDGVKYSAKKANKSLLIYYDRGNKSELKQVKEILKNNTFILPLIFYKSKTNLNSSLIDFQTLDGSAIINSSFNMIINLSSHSYHSLAQIYPWYDEFVNSIANIVNDSDEVIIYGRSTKKYFSNFINNIPNCKLRIID